MNAKQMSSAILLALLLTSLAFPAKCEGGDVDISASVGLRLRPDGEAEIVGSSKITIVLCVRTSWCTRPGNKTCYCCQTLPNAPCFWSQQQCWDACPKAPNRQQSQVPALPPSPPPAVASFTFDEPRN